MVNFKATTVNKAPFCEKTTIEYSPNDGYKLDKVIVDGEEVDITKYPTSYTFENIDKDHTIDVSYKKKVIITTHIDDGGTITPTTSVDENGNLQVDFEVSKGYELDKVIVDGVDVTDKVIDGSYTFENITEDHEISVTTKKIETPIDDDDDNNKDNIDDKDNKEDIAITDGSDNSVAPVEKSAVKTGDDTNIASLALICAISLLGAVSLLCKRRED